jgi:peptide deformylase
MAIRRIIAAPNPVLKEMSAQIQSIDDDVIQLLEDLRDSLAGSEEPGIGLAAVQIGIPRRALVAEIGANEYGGDLVELINPEVVFSTGAQVFEEGCLSVPEFVAEVERPSEVVVAYLDRTGKRVETKFTDICATVVQHEIDHLNGHLFIDHLSRLRRDRVIRRLTKMARRDEAAPKGSLVL